LSTADQSTVNFSLCSTTLSRRDQANAAFNTTNMRNHLRRHHPSVKVTEHKVDVSATTPTTSQPTVQAVFQRSTTWDINDPRAVKQHRLLAEMIALDDQSFSLSRMEVSYSTLKV